MTQTATVPRSTRDTVASQADTQELAFSEFLAFKLGDEEYGIDILQLQDIRAFERPTHLANAPEHVLGAVNLRCVIAPIFLNSDQQAFGLLNNPTLVLMDSNKRMSSAAMGLVFSLA